MVGRQGGRQACYRRCCDVYLPEPIVNDGSAVSGLSWGRLFVETQHWFSFHDNACSELLHDMHVV